MGNLSSPTPDATTGSKGKVQLAGDLGGTAASPTVVGITSGSASNLNSGTLAAARMPALTGDVTTSAGAVATTIGTSKVLTAMINNAAVTADKLSTGAAASDVATSETTTSTSYTGLTTPQAVTVTVGANGLLLVEFGCRMSQSATGNASRASVALSGGNTVASSDNYACYQRSTSSTAEIAQANRSKLFTGLAAGSTTVTMQFKVAAGTGTYLDRTLLAIPL